MTADISAADKADIRYGLALESTLLDVENMVEDTLKLPEFIALQNP
jgi:hypothetical protein